MVCLLGEGIDENTVLSRLSQSDSGGSLCNVKLIRGVLNKSMDSENIHVMCSEKYLCDICDAID